MIGTPDDSAGFDPVQTIDDYAGYYGVPPDLAQSVMQRESGGNHYDRNGQVLTSSRGYRGLMGMHPVTAAMLGLGFNADDPEENVHAGLKYLGQNLQQFNGNQALALAGYHSGPHRAAAALSDPGDPRTKSYVKSILGTDYGGYWQERGDDQPSGPGTSDNVMLNQVGATKPAQSGEADQAQAGSANESVPQNSFRQMLQQMLANKDETTGPDYGHSDSFAEPTTVASPDSGEFGRPQEQQTHALAHQTPYLAGSADNLLAQSAQQDVPVEQDTDDGALRDSASGISATPQEASPSAHETRVDAKRQQPTAGAAGRGTTVPVDLSDLLRQVDAGEITADEFLKRAQQEFGKKLGFEVAEQEALRAQYEPQGWNPFELVFGSGTSMTPRQALDFARRRMGVMNVYVSPRNQEFYDAFRKARPASSVTPPQTAARRQDEGQSRQSDEIWDITDPWSGLTPKEQDIIDAKLERVPGRSARSRFDEIVKKEGDTWDNVLAIKNLIDVAGGHTNSPVWRLIDSIDQVTGNAGGQPLVHVILKKDKDGNPLRKEFAAAFDAEVDGNNKKYIVNDWLDKLINTNHKLDSIRQQTEYSTGYPIHFANDDPERPERYFVHFDPGSPYFRTSQCPENNPEVTPWCQMDEVYTAALSHHSQQVTASEVREFLRRTGQTHE